MGLPLEQLREKVESAPFRESHLQFWIVIVAAVAGCADY